MKDLIQTNMGMGRIMVEEWVICPDCGSKTRVKLRRDTVLKNFPLFCPKCKQESLINAENLRIEIIDKIEKIK